QLIAEPRCELLGIPSRRELERRRPRHLLPHDLDADAAGARQGTRAATRGCDERALGCRKRRVRDVGPPPAMHEQRTCETDWHLDGANHVLDVAGEALGHEARLVERVEWHVRSLADPVESLAPCGLVVPAAAGHSMLGEVVVDG